MAAVVWTDPRVSQIEAPGPMAGWRTVVEHILDVLTEWTECDCAILRAEAADAQHLILEAYKFGPHREADATFAVPGRKSLRFWHGNPFTSCLVQHYPQGSLESLQGDDRDSHTPAEEQFLSKVHWRGSFPITIHAGGTRIAILVAFDEQSPPWLNSQQMSLAWLAAQLIVVQELPRRGGPTVRESFIEASRHVAALAHFESRENELSALLRILCSGRGLGWQRAWLMRSSGASYRCETCAGGLTLDEWGRGAFYASSSLRDLTEEIAHDVVDQPRQDDGLYRACVTEETLVSDRKWFERPRSQGSGKALYVIPTEMSSEGAQDWKNRVNAAFDDREQIYWCPFRVSDDEYVAVLTWSDARTKHGLPQVTETGSILAIASEIMSAASKDERHGAEPPPFIERVTGLLSWVGIAPLSRQEIERAKVRRARLRFQQCQQHQRAVGQQMIDARKRRGGQ